MTVDASEVAAPLVSILVPVYNARPWLALALQSALAQTWRRTELIVVDDGSSDGSWELARTFTAPHCQVLLQPHQGASAARNRAFRQAQGEFVQYLDADDLLAPGKIEAHLRAIRSSEKTLLSFGSVTHFFDPPPRHPHSHLARCDAVDGDPAKFLVGLWDGSSEEEMVQTGQWLTPRVLVEQAGPWNEDLTVDDDGEFFARVILRSTRILPVPDAQTYYRKFRDGRSLSASNNHRDSMRAAQRKCLTLLAAVDDSNSRQAVRNVITREVVRAFPSDATAVQSGLDFLRWHGLTLSPSIDGSPLFQWARRLLGWKAARWLQWRRRRRENPSRVAVIAPSADPLPYAPPPAADYPHPPACPPPAGRCSPPPSSARPRV